MHHQNVVLEQLYRRIQRFVQKRVSHEQDAKDIVQTIFYKLVKHQDKIKQDRLSSWVFKVARHQIIDYYRQKKTQPSQDIMELALKDQQDDKIFQEVASWIDLFILTLKKEDQEILNLTQKQGMTQKEAAIILNLPPQASKARDQRAKKRLKKSLEDCCHYTFDNQGHIIDYQSKNQKAQKQYCC